MKKPAVPQRAEDPSRSGSIEKILAVAMAAALVILGVVFREEIGRVFHDPESLRQWVQSHGAWAPLVFVGLQFLQVVIFVIPGEIVQLAGGYLFGVGWGLLYSLAGILAGSLFNFLLARLLGRAFINGLLGPQALARMRHFIDSPRAVLGFFLLFLIPGIPKDILCYAAGLSAMRLRVFLLISLLGRLPALLGSVLIGSAAGNSNWLLAGILGGAALLLFLLGLLHRERVHRWLEKLTGQQHSAEKD